MTARNKNFKIRALVALAIAIVSPGSALANECSLDSVIFVDKERNKQFTAERVAVNYLYLCDGKFIKATVERPDLKECMGPYGGTIIDGYMDGNRVFAVYSVNKAAPCCSWDSYSGSNTDVPVKVKKWLPTGKAPRIKLGDEWFTITGNEWDPVQVGGPLGGGKFVPAFCRR